MSAGNYSEIEAFFGDYNRIYNALCNGNYSLSSDTPALSYIDMLKGYAIFDERIGIFKSIEYSSIHMLSGDTFSFSSDLTENVFQRLIADKVFIARKKCIGYCLTNTNAYLSHDDVNRVFERIENLLRNKEYLKVKGMTYQSVCWDWYEQ